MMDFLSQHTGYVGFAIGLFCGVPVGIMIIALCQMAGRQDASELNRPMPRVIKR